jgi:hypothetical protein
VVLLLDDFDHLRAQKNASSRPSTNQALSEYQPNEERATPCRFPMPKEIATVYNDQLKGEIGTPLSKLGGANRDSLSDRKLAQALRNEEHP